MKPRIFVSSTFYDLKNIREDLSNFIKAHDFEPIMFEDGDIGYTPGKPLDESCYDAMRSADMVVLIIGGIYGSPATGEKDDFNNYVSVTRNEFETAVSHAIPVYCFIDSKVHSEYGVYETNLKQIEEKNQKINFKVTKNINVFRFIREIKNFGTIPILDFDKSTDIKDYLSKQWADMFKNYLKLLKENKQIGQLQVMMVNIQSLIEQMNVMVNGVGKKVLGDEQDDYKKVVAEQEEIRIKEICMKLCKYVTLDYYGQETTSEIRRKYVNTFLDELSFFFDNSKDSLGYVNDYNRLETNLSEKGLKICLFHSDILNRNNEIYQYIMDKDKKEILVTTLSTEPYFNLMFRGLIKIKLKKSLSEDVENK